MPFFSSIENVQIFQKFGVMKEGRHFERTNANLVA